LEATGHIAKFDAATNEMIDSMPAPPAVQPTSIAITNDSRFGYICNFSLPSERTFIHKFDLGTLTRLRTIQAGSYTHDVKMTSDGSLIIACNMNTDDLTLVYTGADTVAFVNIDPDSVYGIQGMPKYGPHGVAIDHRDSLAYIACMMGFQVRVLDIKARRIVDSIPIPVHAHGHLAGPTLLAISPDDEVIYVTTGGGNSVVIVHLPTKTILADLHLAAPNPFGITITDDGSRVYVACANRPPAKGRIYVIDGEAFAKVDSLDVGRESFGLTWRPLPQ
jgi:DNA-binding beta-propeller fold protein YncE